MAVIDFSFAEHSRTFDAHIEASIPGYDHLSWWCERYARRFIQSGTRVIDIGCSTGALLHRIKDATQASRPTVEYVGIDVEPSYAAHWRARRTKNLRYEVADALSFDGLQNMSLATSVFTMQFVPERQKIAFLKRIYGGLVDGGALLIAEKTLAASPTLQELSTFAYYDHKEKAFSADAILEKERRLRGLMTPWPRARLAEALCSAGFQPQDIESFWQEGPFVAFVAQKRTAFSSTNKRSVG